MSLHTRPLSRSYPIPFQYYPATPHHMNYRPYPFIPRINPYALPHVGNAQHSYLSPLTPRTPAFYYGPPPTSASFTPSQLGHPRPLPTQRLLKTSRDELDESPAPTSPNPRGDKRRRTRKVASIASNDRADSPSVGSNGGLGASPDPDSHHAQYSAGQHQQGQQQQRRVSGLAPIKPIGFAASRENRRESGGVAGDAALPSPVVMGFDFQKVDDDQIKTVSPFKTSRQEQQADSQVRDTISIKAQQEALIAQRRRDLAASTPNTPKELTFKGWQPKDPDRPQPGSAAPVSGSASGSVGRRRDKTRDKVERMSINTAGGDKDVVPGSKVSLQYPS